MVLTSLTRSFKLAVVVLLTVFHTAITYASDATHPKLEKRIAQVCKKDCVDPVILLIAVQQAAEEFSINARTLLAIIEVESGYRDKAVNKQSGKSVGLTQIQVYWHRKKFRTSDHFDVVDNVRVGAIVYHECVKKWKGHRAKALWCYNGHTKRGMKEYVPKVMRTYQEINTLAI